MRISIIGGGMAGMICAIAASFNSNNIITIYERQSALGKKVAITGNGKCNLSNVDVANTNKYSSNNRAMLEQLMQCFDNEECTSFFKKLGLVTTVNKGGIYPASGQAISVVKILEKRLNELGVRIVYDKYIDCIEKTKDAYIVDGEKVDAVVLAFGGKAGIYGENSSCGIEIIKALELKGIRPAPALTGVNCLCDNKQINGVRVHARVSIYDGDEYIYSDEGELQIAEYGLSGIPVFNLTNHLPYNLLPDNNIRFVVDYMPDMTKEELLQYFMDYSSRYDASMLDMMLAVFNDKLGKYMLLNNEIDSDTSVRKVSASMLEKLVVSIKAYSYKFESLRNYKNAQIMKGGVDLSELDDSYMIKKHKNIYAIGEMLDVSGECGGYNLYFAYHSGRVVGEKLAR